MAINSKSNDTLASLMNELGQAQGYGNEEDSVCSTSFNPKKKARRQKSRLLPELIGYPDNTLGVGNHSTWNPYVKCENLPLSSSSSYRIVLPTNPQVEVIRRRSYEKFKKGFYEVLQRGDKHLSIKLPIPSLLEKWHMDSKFEEIQRSIINISEERREEFNIVLDSTKEIRRLYLQQQLQEREGMNEQGKKKNIMPRWVDPILLNFCSLSSFNDAFTVEYKRCLKNEKKSEEEIQQSLNSSKLTKTLKQTRKAVHRLIDESIEYFEKELSAMASLKSSRIPKVQYDVEKQQMKVSFFGLSFAIHVDYYEKLQRLFDRSHQQDDDDNLLSNEMSSSFEEALFCLLCRYDMLQGAGLQAGIPGSVMDVLLLRFDCRMECFASPLNCKYQNFGSAFDLDRLFGSVGSFFHCEFYNGGCFQANPPFCESIIQKMCERINVLLSTNIDDQQQQPLMFVVFVPVWEESEGYQQLLKSKYLSQHLIMDQGKHYYTEGTQYRRKESYRLASFETSIFFYQNNAGREKWSVSDASSSSLGELKRAFTVDPRSADKKDNQREKSKKSPNPMSAAVQVPLPPIGVKMESVKEAKEKKENTRDSMCLVNSSKRKKKSKENKNKEKKKKKMDGKERRQNAARSIAVFGFIRGKVSNVSLSLQSA